MKPIYLPLALAFAALASCNTATKKAEADAVDPAAIEQELKAHEASWMQEYNAKEIDKIAANYDAEAALANPGAPLATDAASRRAGIEQFVADPSLKVDFASDRVGVAKSGDLAYTRGHYSMTTTDPATKQAKTESGNYLTVWKKQADGSWKAIEDFVTPGAPAAPSP